MAIDQTISMLTDADFAQDVAFVAGGYLAAVAAANVFERFVMDLPNELYGILGIAVSTYVPVNARDRKYIAAGSGLYTLDALAQRVGVKESVTTLGGGR